MLSKVGKTFQSLFVGDNAKKQKENRKRLRDDSDEDDDVTITHTKRAKFGSDGTKDRSIFGSVAEYLVRASRSSFSENSLIRGLARQASPHRILERITAFTLNTNNTSSCTNGNHQNTQGVAVNPSDTSVGMDPSRPWVPPNPRHQQHACPQPGALSGTVRPPASTGASQTKTGYVDLPYPFVFPSDVIWSQDGHFKVPSSKPPGRPVPDPRHVRPQLCREPSRMAMPVNNSMYNTPRHIQPMARSAPFQPTYDKLYPAQGVLNLRTRQHSTTSHARSQLATRMSWRLDEKNRYAQMLQQFTSVPLQGATGSGVNPKRENKTATPFRDQTVLGTRITHLSQSQPSIGASQPSLPVVQDVASRPRSPSPEGHLRGSYAGIRISKAHRLTSFDPLRSSGDASFFATSGSRDAESVGRQLPERKTPICLDDDASVVILDSPSTSPSSLHSSISPQSPTCEEFKRSLQERRYTEEWLKNFTANGKEAIRKCAQKKREEEVKLKYFQEQASNWEAELEQRIRHKLKLSTRIPAVEEYEYIESEESEEEGEKEEEFIELTEEQEAIVDDALHRQPANEVLSEGFRLTIRRSDMETLRGLNWLNDEIVNFFFELIRERGKLDNMPSVHVFNTFFYPKVKNQGQQGVRRWTKSVDIFSFDYIAIPIHLGMHWCLAIIDFGNKAIRYFDSMGGKNMECLNLLRRYLADEHQQKKNCPYDLSEWTLENVTGIPQQMNGSDCGIFTCKFADYVTKNRELTFTQEQMPYFRRRMVCEIVSKRLLS